MIRFNISINQIIEYFKNIIYNKKKNYFLLKIKHIFFSTENFCIRNFLFIMVFQLINIEFFKVNLAQSKNFKINFL